MFYYLQKMNNFYFLWLSIFLELKNV